MDIAVEVVKNYKTIVQRWTILIHSWTSYARSSYLDHLPSTICLIVYCMSSACVVYMPYISRWTRHAFEFLTILPMSPPHSFELELSTYAHDLGMQTQSEESILPCILSLLTVYPFSNTPTIFFIYPLPNLHSLVF